MNDEVDILNMHTHRFQAISHEDQIFGLLLASNISCIFYYLQSNLYNRVLENIWPNTFDLEHGLYQARELLIPISFNQPGKISFKDSLNTTTYFLK